MEFKKYHPLNLDVLKKTQKKLDTEWHSIILYKSRLAMDNFAKSKREKMI